MFLVPIREGMQNASGVTGAMVPMAARLAGELGGRGIAGAISTSRSYQPCACQLGRYI